MEILREFYDASKTDLVFSRSGNITPKFYRILREACERAGVPYGRGTRDGLVLHDARHTATTHLLESNISPKTMQERMGSSDKAFVLYYSHATKQSREQAGQSLERLAGRKTAWALRIFIEHSINSQPACIENSAVLCASRRKAIL
jgi:integrase